MKEKSEVVPWILIIASVIGALVLGISLLSESAEPNLAIVFGFLVSVIICFSASSLVAFKGETIHRVLLLVSLLLGSGLVFLLCLFWGFALASLSPAWRDNHPSAVYNMSITVACLFVLASILAVAAIGVLVSILRARRK